MRLKKKKIALLPCLLLIFVFTTNISIEGQNFRNHKNDAFQRGEELSYKFYYDSFMPGYVTVGDGTISIRENSVRVNNDRSAMHIVGTVNSRRFFNWFYRVDNRYETYIDDEAIMPWYFMRDVYEGGYERKEETTFNHYQNVAFYRDEEVQIDDYMQDIISAFYFARTLDFSDIKPGDSFDIDFLFKDSLYFSRIKYEGKEILKTDVGKIQTLKFKPLIYNHDDSKFVQPWPMTLWISDDKNRIPVLFESRVIVGFAKMELSGYKGLKNPFSSIVRK